VKVSRKARVARHFLWLLTQDRCSCRHDDNEASVARSVDFKSGGPLPVKNESSQTADSPSNCGVAPGPDGQWRQAERSSPTQRARGNLKVIPETVRALG